MIGGIAPATGGGAGGGWAISGAAFGIIGAGLPTPPCPTASGGPGTGRATMAAAGGGTGAIGGTGRGPPGMTAGGIAAAAAALSHATAMASVEAALPCAGIARQSLILGHDLARLVL